MIGVLENVLPDTLHARSKGDSVCAAFRTFKTLLSIPDHYSSTPLLQQPRDLRARFWPPSRGLNQYHVLWAWLFICLLWSPETREVLEDATNCETHASRLSLITEHNREIFGRRVFHGEAQVEVSKIRAVSMEVRFLAISR